MLKAKKVALLCATIPLSISAGIHAKSFLGFSGPGPAADDAPFVVSGPGPAADDSSLVASGPGPAADDSPRA